MSKSIEERLATIENDISWIKSNISYNRRLTIAIISSMLISVASIIIALVR